MSETPERSRSSACFEHHFTVRFFEVDRAGIAFFGRAFEYAHTAFEEMLAAADHPLTCVFDEGGWGMPLVHVEADFKRPMRMGDTLRVLSYIERVGRTSIAFEHHICGAGDDDLRAIVQLTHVIVDLEGFRKRAVPEELLSALTSLGLIGDE